MRLSFEWDEEKAAENYHKHGVSFEEGVTIFCDPLSMSIPDPDHSTNEQRYIDIGASEDGRVLVVSYTEREEICALSVAGKQREENGDSMKKASTKTTAEGDDMRAEYDFTGGIRGKHYGAMQGGYTITVHQADGSTEVREVKPHEGAVVLAPDVLEYFPDSESVNAALRSLIKLIPSKRRRASKKEAEN